MCAVEWTSNLLLLLQADLWGVEVVVVEVAEMDKQPTTPVAVDKTQRSREEMRGCRGKNKETGQAQVLP